eukprot:TRINITY_DN4800_c0_g1_i1.p1 TRINITY_DN4800_c0_g1~~TRINITY_DN4800_c0_g1_i1.p1  ORF type:complete len:334 (+),score=91.50 TRINITY_DN4800_c0_g1_i1:87-1088(+)
MFANNQNPNNDLELPQPPSDSVSSLKWAPTTNLLAASSWDKSVRVWQVALTGQCELKFGHELASPIVAAAWNGESSALFTTHGDGKVNMVDLATKNVQQVGAHQSGLQALAYIPELKLLATGGWDKQLHYWDLRQPKPALSVAHKAPIFSLDCRHPLLVTSDADSTVAVFNLNTPQQVFKQKASPLKLPTRRIGAMVDKSGFVICAAEGRCAVQFIDDAQQSRNFSYRCHRVDTTTYAVNDISFHPLGTFVTCGSDGVYNFWDYNSKSRLKPSQRMPGPLSAIGFNGDGTMAAYAQGYDWHQGVQGASSAVAVKVFVHKVDAKEVTPRPPGRK